MNAVSGTDMAAAVTAKGGTLASVTSASATASVTQNDASGATALAAPSVAAAVVLVLALMQ